MRTNDFKRAAALVAPAKDIKARIRLLPRKTQTALAFQATLGLNVAVAAVQTQLRAYILGNQLTQELRDSAKPAMGEVFQHAIQLARVLKVKVPSSGKKVSLKGITFTEALLTLGERATSLQVSFSEILSNGAGLGEDNLLDALTLDSARDEVGLLIADLYAFSYSVLGVVPAELLQEHYEFLVSVHGKELLAEKPAEAPAAE